MGYLGLDTAPIDMPDYPFGEFIPAGQLKDVGANPDSPLEVCQGDCDSDDDCKGDLECFHKVQELGNPPGCMGMSRNEFWDYCYDPTWATKFCGLEQSAPMVDVVTDVDWTFTEWYAAHYFDVVAVLALLIAVLCGLNLCVSTGLCRSNGPKEKTYAAVKYMESETELEEVIEAEAKPI